MSVEICHKLRYELGFWSCEWHQSFTGVHRYPAQATLLSKLGGTAHEASLHGALFFMNQEEKYETNVKRH
jgi:hypothetical protein